MVLHRGQRILVRQWSAVGAESFTIQLEENPIVRPIQAPLDVGAEREVPADRRGGRR